MNELLLNEINATIKILESEIPANPGSERNEKLEGGLARELSKYFKHLDDAVSIEGLERIYYRNVKED